eukprot:GDKI01023058.1.p1 GENE.GDKI01023058.1~~GDKI01023058.1.p1  ORF type:complete len:179 (-),score=42.35 GDKI01023058.1:53-589(-)
MRCSLFFSCVSALLFVGAYAAKEDPPRFSTRVADNGEDGDPSVNCYTLLKHTRLPKDVQLKTDMYRISVHTHGLQSGLDFCAHECSKRASCRGVSVIWVHEPFRPYKCELFSSEKTGVWWTIEGTKFEDEKDTHILVRMETDDCFPGLDDAKHNALSLNTNYDATEWHMDRLAVFLAQ